MPRIEMVCSVCDEQITRKTREPVVVINSLKAYNNWALEAGDPPVRRHLVLCPKHVNYIIEPMKEMNDERQRLAGIKDDRPGDSA